jgi:hypothetical protein
LASGFDDAEDDVESPLDDGEEEDDDEDEAAEDAASAVFFSPARESVR